MFTSRSEFRLINRAENSDFRLTPKAIDLGILSEQEIDAFKYKTEAKKKAFEMLPTFHMPSNKWFEQGITQASPRKCDQLTAQKILSFAGVKFDEILKISNLEIDPLVKHHVFVECQYENYIIHQQKKAS